MKTSLQSLQNARRAWEEGKIGWALLWLIGVPLPILLIFYLFMGGN